MKKVIGIQRIDYVNKSGRNVTGSRVFLVYAADDIFGNGAESEFISSKYHPLNVKVGDNVQGFAYSKVGSTNNFICTGLILQKGGYYVSCSAY